MKYTTIHLHTSLTHRIPSGEGDVHLPPGWGTIPHVEALRQFHAFSTMHWIALAYRQRTPGAR
jgi:hypothetical protein